MTCSLQVADAAKSRLFALSKCELRGDVALERLVAPEQSGSDRKRKTTVQRLVDRHAEFLDEIKVDADDVDAQRFYRRHGYADIDPDTGLPAYYFSREL